MALPNTSGIYTITCLVNNKIYLGKTYNLYSRKQGHFSALRNNKHWNTHLQNAWNKYGEKSFIFDILEEWEIQFLITMEHYWCNILNVHDINYGYNIQPTHPDKISSRHSKETKDFLSTLKKETYLKENNPFYGKKHSIKTRENWSKIRKGKNYVPILKRYNSSVKVEEYDKNNNLIKIWNNIKELKNFYNYSSWFKKLLKINKKEIFAYKDRYFKRIENVKINKNK